MHFEEEGMGGFVQGCAFQAGRRATNIYTNRIEVFPVNCGTISV